VIKTRRKAYGNEDVREERISSGGDAVEGEGRVPRGDALIASPPPFLEGRTPGGEVPERPTQCTRSTPSGKWETVGWDSDAHAADERCRVDAL
jgi:hypothetical protein